MPDKQPVNILWTGGWDSTFQLLRLLLDQRRPVQPFYLRDSHRGSTELELQTIERIRERLFERHPHTGELLAPVKQSAVADIAPDAEITDAWSAIRARQFLGRQYDWLARFCKQQGISDMQLSIHRVDRAHFIIEKAIARPADSACSEGGAVFRLDPALASAEVCRLFGGFAFPLLELTKVQMARIARQRGWEDIMKLTWFCQRPLPGPRPCGTCNPCAYTIEEGLGWRIPMTSRVRYVVYCRALPTARKLAGGLLRGLGIKNR